MCYLDNMHLPPVSQLEWGVVSAYRIVLYSSQNLPECVAIIVILSVFIGLIDRDLQITDSYKITPILGLFSLSYKKICGHDISIESILK